MFDGVKMAVVPLYVTVPGIVFVPSLNVNVAFVIVLGVTGSLKVALMAALGTTFAAASTGVVADTVGGIVSGAIPVMKLQK
jgi:hypothetical protein